MKRKIFWGVCGVILIILLVGTFAYLIQGGTQTQTVPVLERQDDTAISTAPSEPPPATQTEATYTKETAAPERAREMQVVTVHAKNYRFFPDKLVVKKGQTIQLTLVNDGGSHDFVIDEIADARTARISSGERETIMFVADTAGAFAFYCSVGPHRALGMEGVLVVE